MSAVNIADSARNNRIISAFRKWWYLVLLAGLVGGMGAFGASYAATPIFHSNASLFFSLRGGADATDLNQGATYTQNQMLSFAQLATSSVVLSRVQDDLGIDRSLKELRRETSVELPQNTVVLHIGVDTPDRVESARIANSIGANLKDAVEELAPSDGKGRPAVAAHIVAPAVPASYQSSPDKRKNGVLGGLLGLFLSALAIGGISALDTRVRSVSALKTMTRRPILGFAERTRKSDDRRPIVLQDPNGSAAERYRQIREGLRFASANREIKSTAITSAVPREGKTMTSLNLALILAETKDRVLLIDADLRRPRIADYLGLEGAVGLSTVLIGRLEVNEAVQRFGETSLDVLSAGDIPPNPAELLVSTQMVDLITDVSREYDHVIIDTPPVLSVSDMAVIAQLVDSSIVVIDSSKLRQRQLDQAIDSIETAGANIAGLILNRVKISNRRERYYRNYQSTPHPNQPVSNLDFDVPTRYEVDSKQRV